MTDDYAAKTYLGLDEGNQQVVREGLQRALANSLFLYHLYKKYHWHVAGEDFYPYHKLFDKHAEQQLPIIDDVAERLRTLGVEAKGMPADVATLKTIDEPAEPKLVPQNMVQNLLDVHEALLIDLRKTISAANQSGDEGTSDLLVSDVLRVHELQIWFLRASISS